MGRVRRTVDIFNGESKLIRQLRIDCRTPNGNCIIFSSQLVSDVWLNIDVPGFYIHYCKPETIAFCWEICT